MVVIVDNTYQHYFTVDNIVLPPFRHFLNFDFYHKL
jgi:hypothetical protein